MLRRLMLRDLLLTRRTLLANAGVFFAFLFYLALEASSPRAYVLFASVMMCFLPVTIFTRENLAKAEAATCVLPVSRVEVVRARVLLSWLMMAGGMTVALALGTLLPGSEVGGGALLEPRVLLFSVTVLGLACALLLPLVIRFGFTGIIAFLVASQGVGLVVMLLAMSPSGRTVGRPLRGVAGWLSSWTGALQELAPPPVLAAGLVGSLCLVGYLSYRTSIVLFRNKAL